MSEITREIVDSSSVGDQLGSEGGVTTYITVAQVREHGRLTATQYTDDQIANSIILWQETIERICRQWFYAKELDLEIDGNDSDTLMFGVPPISISAVYINSATVVLDSSYYKVYTDKLNPRIKLVHSTQLSDIYVSAMLRGELKFVKGYKNQRIVGTFGHVIGGNRPPRPIQWALLKLVVEKLTHPMVPSSSSPQASTVTIAGVAVSETTDGHSISYSQVPMSNRRSWLSGITGDPEIADILAMYRAPAGVASSAIWSY